MSNTVPNFSNQGKNSEVIFLEYFRFLLSLYSHWTACVCYLKSQVTLEIQICQCQWAMTTIGANYKEKKDATSAPKERFVN